MAGNGKTVRFVTHLLNQLQGGRFGTGMHDASIRQQQLLVTWAAGRPLRHAH